VIVITELEVNRIICGDNREILKTFPDNSIDSLTTDPPYALVGKARGGSLSIGDKTTPFGRSGPSKNGVSNKKGFMGKEWDGELPGVPFWQEALRIAKPGAHALIFGGTKTFHRLACNIEDAGWELIDTCSWNYAQGFPKSRDINKCDPSIAEGIGYALKPAWEPITLCRKPLEGTVAQNIHKWGVGGLYIDQCRIRYANETDKLLATPQGLCTAKSGALAGGLQNNNIRSTFERPIQKGRFPANVLFDEDAARMLDEQSGILKSGSNCTRTKVGSFLEHGGLGKAGDVQITYGDSGGASRFFFCGKASTSERNAGLLKGIKNPNPCVKPISLMRYLVRLVTPSKGVILDPFCGSGSTLIAAELEKFNYIGIDMEQEYVDTANLRMAYYKGLNHDSDS
jgi:site-specific DNA-methyltransferase (adenine-specific)